MGWFNKELEKTDNPNGKPYDWLVKNDYVREPLDKDIIEYLHGGFYKRQWVNYFRYKDGYFSYIEFGQYGIYSNHNYLDSKMRTLAKERGLLPIDKT